MENTKNDSVKTKEDLINPFSDLKFDIAFFVGGIAIMLSSMDGFMAVLSTVFALVVWVGWMEYRKYMRHSLFVGFLLWILFQIIFYFLFRFIFEGLSRLF
jgi:hypothetical protein